MYCSFVVYYFKKIQKRNNYYLYFYRLEICIIDLSEDHESFGSTTETRFRYPSNLLYEHSISSEIASKKNLTDTN